MLLVHGFWPEFFAVDVFTLGLLGILVILVLRPLLKSATLPGGAAVEFRNELQAGEESHQQVEARIEEEASATPDASERMREVHALFVIPDYLRDLVPRDPNLALAGLRMELEQSLRLASKVLQGGSNGKSRQPPLSRVVDELAELGHSMPTRRSWRGASFALVTAPFTQSSYLLRTQSLSLNGRRLSTAASRSATR